MRKSIHKAFSKEAVKAKIHALAGEDKDNMVAYAQMLIFVAMVCAKKTNKTESPEYRICDAGINVMDDIKESPIIKDVDRVSIHRAMDAAMQIIESTSEEIVTEAALLLANYGQ